MAATIAQVIDGLETALSTITGLRVRDHIPESVEPPMAFVMFARRDFHGAMQQGITEFDVDVTVIVGRQVARTSQAAALAYADQTGDDSIRAAIEADRTLGLANCDVLVESVDRFQYDDAAGGTWLSLRFVVKARVR